MRETTLDFYVSSDVGGAVCLFDENLGRIFENDEQQNSFPLRYQREAMSKTSTLKPFIKRAYCPYKLALNNETKDPLTLNE